MKASDLQLGDWVQGYLQDTYAKIYGIFNEVRLAITTKDTKYVELSVEDLQPIPITPEILKQNGFGYIEHDKLGNLSHYYLGERWYCKNMDLHIGTDNKGNYWLNYPWYNIHGLCYVHELQHALRMCHIIMEIEL